MEDLTRLEFHRAGIGLVPSSEEGAGQAIFIASLPDTHRPHFSCSCEESGRKPCSHLQELDRRIRSLDEDTGGGTWDERFTLTLWNRIAGRCADEDPVPAASMRVFKAPAAEDTPAGLAFVDRRGRELARWYDDSPARQRFLERLGKTPGNGSGNGHAADRAAILARLGRLQLTPQERRLEREGAKSTRQAREDSFWFRLAYHCARELGQEGLTFRPAVNRDTGAFTFTCSTLDENGAPATPIVRFAVPGDAVKPVLRLLTREYPADERETEDEVVAPIPLRTLFHVGPGTQMEGDPKVVRPAIVTLKRFGERRYLERDESRVFRYGRLQYVPELEVLTELEEPGKERKFKTPQRLRTERAQVPSFADDTPAEAASEIAPGEEAGSDLKIFRGFDRIEIRAEKVTLDGKPIQQKRTDGGGASGGDSVDDDEAEERSWYWLSVHYGAGSARVSLTDLLRARKEGLPYLEVPDGWIDLSSEAVDAVEAVFDDRDPHGPLGHPAAGDRFQLGLPDLLRLHASSDEPLPLQVDADGDAREILDRMVQLRPAQPYRQPKALTSKLRDYQVHGTNWLRFLAENGLGGLLCDDMGLGKTHQAMALMASLSEQDHVYGPFLVVCPTTVLPHWKAKLRDHAPGLRAAIHHGPQRDLDRSLRRGDIILTSYGILRNDSIELASVPFAAVIFDEIQHLKNRDTVSYRAATTLDAHVRLGLTGTPVENTLTELKALFDIVLPGYLGSDARFLKRYGELGEGEEGFDDRATRLEELRRVISPFILRRTKEAVLDELPEKIEDLRLCSLSEDQISLYREAVEGPGAAEIVGRLESGTDPVPYIHVFALLNVLKRICDHPALATNQLEDAGDFRSGKWDLFKELLDEALDNGQKVVVFTQYLGMVDLISWHLEELGVGYVTLTGSSRNRGELVDRFNQDPDTRVFVGSLKAGGTGIDLIGGSVVIHYDRWWNSAREDQATDRVHRMGQKRAVQVFKLITEGTLEEKIHSIIERKRRLADAVIQEDDPKLSKLFTREEILDLLRPVSEEEEAAVPAG